MPRLDHQPTTGHKPSRLQSSALSQILHHWQKRIAILRMARVLAARCAAKTRLLKKVQDLCKVSAKSQLSNPKN
jgi:hypothetical protein